jgi:radical SAM superfamily enzyme YgiQ (UPF0313 family)
MIQYNHTYQEFCLWLKHEYPEIHLIYGSTMLPQFDTDVFDYYVVGFGENGLKELLKYLYSNGQRPRFELLLDSKKKVINADNNYPAHPLKDARVIYERRDYIQSYEWLGIEFSRGCKFKCSFCNSAVLGVKGDYSRDSEDARLELQDNFDLWGVTNYIVSDDTFNDRTEKITKFADVVETLTFKPWFSAFIRADLLASRSKDREELLRMGVNGHFYGIESFNTKTLKAFKKGSNPERIKQTLLEVKDMFSKHNGYRGTIGIIVGGPYETVQSQQETFDWLNEHWAYENVLPNTLQIFEGKTIWKSLLSESYETYGYRKMSDDAVAKYGAHKILDMMNFKTMTEYKDKTTSYKILWENEHFNSFTANDAKDAYYNTIGGKMTISAFTLSYLSKDSIQDRLTKLQNRYMYQNIDVSLLENYKKFKLSL